MCGGGKPKAQPIPQAPRVNSDAAEAVKERVRSALLGIGFKKNISTSALGTTNRGGLIRAKLLGGGG